MKFYTLPTLPYDLANTPAFFTLSHLIKLLSETNPGTAISAVLKEVNRLLQEVQPLLESTNPGSDLLQYIDVTGMLLLICESLSIQVASSILNEVVVFPCSFL